MRKLLPIAIFALALLLVAGRTKADPVNMADGVTFALVQADLSGSAGDILTWQYDVTNDSGGTIYGVAISSYGFTGGVGNGLVFDGFGAGIANGSSMKGTLFAFDSDPSVKSSFNSGIFDLNILLGDFVTTIDLDADYSATIKKSGSTVPEPASLMLLGSGIAALLLLRRRLV